MLSETGTYIKNKGACARLIKYHTFYVCVWQCAIVPNAGNEYQGEAENEISSLKAELLAAEGVRSNQPSVAELPL